MYKYNIQENIDWEYNHDRVFINLLNPEMTYL